MNQIEKKKKKDFWFDGWLVNTWLYDFCVGKTNEQLHIGSHSIALTQLITKTINSPLFLKNPCITESVLSSTLNEILFKRFEYRNIEI